jgi:uncharacterized membrane protein YfcA
MDVSLIVAFVAIGCVIGFLAGLLGIGGGMAMVVGLSVLLIAAAAGVVWFFSSNNLL